MGKKSRLKKERKKLSTLEKKLFSIGNYNKPIYRFFPEEWQAESLCNGNVWISTLETCRKYEDPLQGDSKEAIHTYNTGHIHGHGTNSNLVTIASRAGIHIDSSCKNITISDNKSIQQIQDAYVICFTHEFNPDLLSGTFGKYCVKISNPKEFFTRVSHELNNKSPIKEAAMGLVKYKKREFIGLENSPGPIGFVKPSIYDPQKEFRNLWIPESQDNLDPFLLNCPSINELCSFIT